jgi:hypothetical protein
MPPRRGTAWATRGSLLSDRIPPPASPQPTKSEKGKGKGKAKAATPEPPPRSAAVRRLDELLSGLTSSSTSNQSSRNEIKRAATAPGAASADREGCFCQGMSPSVFSLPLSFLPFPSSLTLFVFPIHHECIQTITSHQPKYTHYQNTRPSAHHAASSSASNTRHTAPARTAPRRSSRRPRARRSSRS